MKLSYVIFVLFLFSPLSIVANEYIGQVVFYTYQLEDNKQDNIEIEADFSHHVGRVLKYLDQKHIKYEIIRKSEFTVDTLNGEQLHINRSSIPVPTGYVMIKKNGHHIIRSGMGTDVDMLMDIYEYFGIKL